MVLSPDDALAGIDITPTEALRRLIQSQHLCSRRWVWEQYDHMVMGDTVQRPGGDSAVVRLHGTNRGLAITTDCTPRYCVADPVQGGRQAVAEAWRNLTAVGATPLAITDNMNFGNPERPEIMGQFAGCIQGMAEACNTLDFPVVSGNVSLYNETNGNGIAPTPTIGGVGLIKDIGTSMATTGFNGPGEIILMIGKNSGHLGRSLLLRVIADLDRGAPPPVDLSVERRNGDFVRGLIQTNKVLACHDVSDGGMLVTVAEMVLASGIGAELQLTTTDLPALAWYFGEDQGRYVISVSDADPIIAAAELADVPATVLGTTGGTELTVAGSNSISFLDLQVAHEGWLPEYMAMT